MLKGQTNPLMIVAAVVIALAGIGVVIWKATAGASKADAVIVKPVDPNDPKFKPNPKLNLSGGGV